MQTVCLSQRPSSSEQHATGLDVADAAGMMSAGARDVTSEAVNLE